MLTNHFFKDLYDDRWGDPNDPNAAEPASLPKDGERPASRGILGRLHRLFGRGRRLSAWSFTIPGGMPEPDHGAFAGPGEDDEAVQPKFLNVAKALSRNC
ncbi:hypothetical protein [Rhizobium sp. BK602]|uniref:hypothetical protein n=1 Tax=Rhizobium sp. BK602 TaxID=2586986 RepID=UPI00160CA7F7|nr:hypothetical protein [Rhizobium sp. BK602]MBB3612836.1 hypothetical protein [Rhizobium sp. BK602]